MVNYEKNESLRIYIEQINKFNLLSLKEEIALSKSIKKGDEIAYKKLVNSNLRLVVRIAKNYFGAGFARTDLIQEGNLGLMKAAVKYDHRKGIRFSTYASWWIKQAITRALIGKSKTIKLPVRKYEILRRYHSAVSKNSLNIEEFTRQNKISPKRLSYLLFLENISSLDCNFSTLSEEDSTPYHSYHAVVGDEREIVEERLIADISRRELCSFLESTLKPKELDIITERFGFNGHKKPSLKKLGDKYGVSPEAIRQREKNAIKELKKKRELASYLES